MTDAAISPEAARLILRFRHNRWSAHRQLFKHRHPDDFAPAHQKIVADIYDKVSRKSIEGFRGLGKSTYLEEAAVLRACYREFRYMVILSASYEMACMRLAAIKREFEINPLVAELFGMQKGTDVWRENRIVLANGLCIQALGREQSMTGIKYLDWRPDAVLIDDVEDPEEVRTDAERQKTWIWFIRTFLPALDDPVTTWIRMLATRRGAGSLPERVESDGWSVAKYPIEYFDPSGKRAATWPSKFPIPKIDAMKHTYRGDLHTWEQEYMCRSYSEAARVFSRDMLRCEPRPRSWQAVWAMYDPARTAHRQSATTGVAVWSWFGNRLVFWRIAAEVWMPDQIIDDMFAVAREYDPVLIGFEKDGLSEWALQPIRAEMLKRRMTLPLLPVAAPKGKLGFIQGLQPYMKAGEVTFAGPASEFQDAIDQFLSFPRGKIDAPNACAYALLLRPGAPVFDSFSEENIVADLDPVPAQPLYLAGNADGSLVTAALVQRAEGTIRILADWVREGHPSDVVADIHAEAMLGYETSRWQDRAYYDKDEPLRLPEYRNTLTRMPIRWIVPAWHSENYRNVGLVQAIRQIPQGVSTADNQADRGRIAISRLLVERRRGLPCLSVGTAARWTLRGFSGGYSRQLDRRGIAGAEADSNIYQLLMEGIEAFAGVGLPGEEADEVGTQPVAHDRFGVAYKSAMPQREAR